ncbi:MAG: GIY-YIG nuclease family protein [Candidatus Moranbacteria bacterium]|nr:GIY-YIG nuclease family protein [Candidatus Moranbacteria bacterium]
MHFVYSLKCKDGYYIGCTDDLKERLSRHQNGYVPATKNRLPVELDFYVAIQVKYKAFESLLGYIPRGLPRRGPARRDWIPDQVRDNKSENTSWLAARMIYFEKYLKSGSGRAFVMKHIL